MNPFDWAGPPFLLFYITLIGVTAATLHAAVQIAEDGPAPTLAARGSVPDSLVARRHSRNRAHRGAIVA